MRATRMALALAAAALLAPAARALVSAHLDDFAAAVSDRLDAFPVEGLTRPESRRRRALEKASAALEAASSDSAGDLLLAKKAAKAVEKAFVEDADLLASLEAGLDGYAAEAAGLFGECEAGIDALEDGVLATRLGKKAAKAGGVLDAADVADLPSARAALLRSAFRILVPLGEAIDDAPGPGPGDCPEPDPLTGANIGVGTFTAVVDGVPWQSTWTEGFVIVDSASGQIRQIQVRGIKENPSNPGVRDAWESLALDFDDFSFDGTGDYGLTALAAPWGSFVPYHDSIPVYTSGSGTISVTEFSMVPDDSEGFARGRIAGTFQFSACDTLGSEGCSGDFISVTSGTFEICNFDFFLW